MKPRKWNLIVVVVVLFFASISLIAAPLVILYWEHQQLASSLSESSVRSLLGQPERTFHHRSEIEAYLGRWDFHDVRTGKVSFTREMPVITDRACLYRGRIGVLTEYIVYFDGPKVTHAYYLGTN